MGKKIKAVPDGMRTLTPYIVLNDAKKGIEFYQKAFGAEEKSRMPSPDGRIMHADIQIGDSRLMLSSEFPEMGGTCVSPKTLRGVTGSILIYTEDVDALFKRAIEAGAEVISPPADMFWGDRFGKVRDPFGHEWQLATHIEDVTPEETLRRMSAMSPKG
jgi:PhnB protein